MVVDAILGFSAHGALRSPYDVIIRTINESSLPVACIDIPSGWDVDEGDVRKEGIQHADMLISLTAPKACARFFQTNTNVVEYNLVHGDLDLDGGVNLDGGDASHDVHGTTHETFIRTLTQPDRSLSCGFSSRGAPKSWYPHRKGTCGW